MTAVEQRRVKAALVILAAASLFQLFVGIVSGLAEDWARMSLFLFGFLLFFFYFASGLMTKRLCDRLSRLEDRFQIERTPRPKGVRRMGTIVNILVILSISGLLSLSALAGFHADCFWLGLGLTACAFVVIVWTNVSTVTVIGMHLAGLEQLPAPTRKAENA